MTVFRPCIDLHDGQVKQIVGGSLSADGSGLKTNFVSPHPPGHFAAMYRRDGLVGGHVIKLGAGNDPAAKAAISAWPDAFHVGGGIDLDNAQPWIEGGAAKIIVTSWLFPDGVFSEARLAALAQRVSRNRLVVDLSCRRRGEHWFVATNRWQTLTDFAITEASLLALARHCSEFLIHAADVEGLCSGIDEALVAALGRWSTLPCTYAGGGKDIGDLQLVDRLSGGRIDLTFGSALDIFGGSQVRYADCVAWNRASARHH